MDTYMGTITLYALGYLPQDWCECDGRELQVSQYEALYSLLGTTYGGKGGQTFCLPDLREKVPVQGMKYGICLNGIYPTRP